MICVCMCVRTSLSTRKPSHSTDGPALSAADRQPCSRLGTRAWLNNPVCLACLISVCLVTA